MRPRVKASLLWGVIGALSFLVLHQAYLLLDGEFTSVGAVAGVTLLVGVAAAGTSYLAEGWLDRKERV
ncbi:hypothetical protein SAMN06269185_3128 [Natronoarchaeum philippinense]|uniref:DUF7981 domain-containing protein n=1 Tax=Natronoarchaeum philippinense TaxID=558529 RepID=A0A285P7W4_NATPI|nr:hypothetical protein [Natronoarchaeum philippinense]SNZ17802.1 hypothetical protein SAMN06269185_3128 [Natronoarchaeum philippinense]